jgi:hypothetical protein
VSVINFAELFTSEEETIGRWMNTTVENSDDDEIVIRDESTTETKKVFAFE